MDKIQCELCSGNNIMKIADNVFECQTCGCRYTLQQAKLLVTRKPIEIVTHKTESDKNLSAQEIERKVFQFWSNIDWESTCCTDFIHYSSYAEYLFSISRSHYFLIPATGKYYCVTQDGNYYHGYDTDVEECSEQTIQNTLAQAFPLLDKRTLCRLKEQGYIKM